jgi:hypothetical protein
MVSNKYTFTIATVVAGFGVHRYSKELYEIGSTLMSFVYTTEPLITDAAKIVAQLKDNKKIDGIVDKWVKMEENGGLKAAINSKKVALTTCAEQANINPERAKELVECLKGAFLKGAPLSRMVDFIECSKMTPIEAIGDINKVMSLGHCIVEDFYDQ